MNSTVLYEQSIDYFLAPVRPLLDDTEVSEILINGPDVVFYERKGQLHRAAMTFPDGQWLESLANNIAEYVGRKLDAAHHSLSGQLPVKSSAKGARIHIVIPPAARNGYCIAIRKFKERRFTLAELVTQHALSMEAATFLELAVLMKCNIAISGGTGTGKTTLLNSLAAQIPRDERILVIEETSELQLDQPHAVYFETQQGDRQLRGQVTIRDLFVDSLRLRPDRIIVGEVRRGEALDMVQSMLSGHAGALTTVHANSPLDALTRLETLCLMTEEALPHYVARLQVASAIHLIVQIERRHTVRRVKCIHECRGLSSRDRYRLRPIFSSRLADADGALPSLVPTGKRPRWAPEARHLANIPAQRALPWLWDATATNGRAVAATKNIEME